MNTQLATDTGQQNAKTFAYADGPRVGRPITGGASWWAQWFTQKNTSTPVPINDPPEHLPNYNPGERLTIMQQRDANGDLADRWSSTDHSMLFGSFGHLPIRRLPIERRNPLPGVAPPTGSAGPPGGVRTPLPIRNPLPHIDPPSNDGSSSDPTTNLEQQLVQQMGNTAPLGGIGATVPVEQQTIGGGGGSNALPVLALLAVAIGAIAFLYLHRKKSKAAEGNADASA